MARPRKDGTASREPNKRNLTELFVRKVTADTTPINVWDEKERGLVLRLVRRWLPITPEFVGGRFFVQREGRRWATPLLVVLLIVETTDVLFAVDSIPAVLAISRDPFIVYTSNVFAILGLRALYFALAGMLGVFHYLHYGLAVILMFIGAKMLASGCAK